MEETEDLLDVRLSAILLAIGGSLVGLAAIASVAMVFLPGLRIRTRSGWLSPSLFFLLYLLVLSAFAVACLRVASGLYQLRTWARYSAVGIGAFVLALGMFLLLDVSLPKGSGSFHSDDGYAVLMSPFMIGPGIWLSVYLNLPHVSRRFRKLPAK